MLKFITKLFGGSKSEKEIQAIQPIVEQINTEYKGLSGLSDEELQSKTDEFRLKIKNHVQALEDEKSSIEQRLKDEALDTSDYQDAHANVERLEKEIFDSTQEILDQILPEAYAVVKDVCRRFTERELSYEYVGNKTTWAMIPYDVQLIGAVVLHDGKIAEMATGEGKTLVSIMPLYLNALTGKGVHLVTVNDYLARRDCEWMKPVFEFLGISSAYLQPKMDLKQRQKVYGHDITYGTNNEFGFDYLRDNMVQSSEQIVQKEHNFAIVDEVDSVLVDEARTPLIIAGPVPKSTANQKYDEMKSRVQKLNSAQSQLINKELADIQKYLDSDKKEDRATAGIKLLKAYKGLPKHRKLLKLKQDPEIAKLLQATELDHLKDQEKKMHDLKDTLYYVVEEKNRSIEITDLGRDLITNDQEDPDMFVIPDLADELSLIRSNETLNIKEKAKKEDELNIQFAERSDKLHTIQQLLKAFSLFERDVDYVVQEGKVQIVDEHTGRILDGRRYSDGLHQAIEAKENVKVEKDTQTHATITLQNYYRMYNKLGGMTGTAETEAAEFEKIYGLEVVVVPTNRPIVRDDQNDVLYQTRKEKYQAIIEKTKEFLEEGRAVLIGTASVEVSEILSRMFKREKISHQLLNAKHHDKEADIVTTAGRKGAVTIATNMAGRGTDIKLDKEVKDNGGLAIIGSERHDSRRIDRQLRGRAGRQGDPGLSKFFISMEDNLMRLFGGERNAAIMSRLKIPEGEPIEAKMMNSAVERAQKKVEENNFSVRKRLLDYDEPLNQQREVIYKRRKHALSDERLKGEIFEYIEDLSSQWYHELQNNPELDYNDIVSEARLVLLTFPELDEQAAKALSEEEFIQQIIDAADEFYKRKEELVGSDFMRQLEKVAFLQTIDSKWTDHLRMMDDLKEGIGLRSYGQKDPVVEFKREAFELFKELIIEINRDTVNFAFKYFPQVIQKAESKSEQKAESKSEQKEKPKAPELKNSTPSMSNFKFERTDSKVQQAASQGQSGRVESSHQPTGDATNIKTITRTKPKIKPNEKVKVKFSDGSIKEVKYKIAEKQIEQGTASIVD
ncbi:preprotein translocase subunit SecA [Candidatus Kapabacteria bacterium]|nr:preprotein translocase subunit SecA [Candidatus Kapabacteria bacterium]